MESKGEFRPNNRTKIDCVILVSIILVLFNIDIDSFGASGELKRWPDQWTFDSKFDNKRLALSNMIIARFDQRDPSNSGNLRSSSKIGHHAYYSESQSSGQSPIWVELGYISAMEAIFVGMSYLASRNRVYGPVAASSFDLFLGFAGLNNASYQDTGVHKVGHYLISASFFIKSLYNFKLGKNQSKSKRFWINFSAYNILVFTGYFLDSLR